MLRRRGDQRRLCRNIANSEAEVGFPDNLIPSPRLAPACRFVFFCRKTSGLLGPPTKPFIPRMPLHRPPTAPADIRFMQD